MKIWDLYAPFYKKAMSFSQKEFEIMCEKMIDVIKDKDVLELATGPGTIAKMIASKTHKIIATDYAQGMINQAKKGSYPDNLTFEIADALNLQYEDNSFDVVIISGALHIIPEPKKVLKEIDRVLKPSGVLIAPCFIAHKKSSKSKIWSNILKLVGVKFENEWTALSYKNFLKENGWEIIYDMQLDSKITFVYVECIKNN